MPYHRKTKIVATLGTATNSREQLENIVSAGVNVARFNFAHGSHDEHYSRLQNLRHVSSKLNLPITVLQDLLGPKIRTGEFETETVTLKNGASLTLTTKEIYGNDSIVTVRYKTLPTEIKGSQFIYLDDDKIKLEIKKITAKQIQTRVLVGGTIRGRRGVNVPGANLKISCITDKDRSDIEFGIKNHVDLMALSFVRKASDVEELRNIIGSNRKIGIISKVETKKALENIDEIIQVSDGIMIARGDLAVEIPNEDVPLAQKMIIKKCTEAGKPVITATQMLDSMIINPVPTRAEVNDVANAIMDGTDAVMLSGETAIGAYPTSAVETMDRIAKRTESSDLYTEAPVRYKKVSGNITDAVSSAVVKTAYNTAAVAIVAFSETGFTARMVSRYKPQQPIIVLTPRQDTAMKVNLSFGCYPKLISPVHTIEEASHAARAVLLEEKLAKKGDTFIISAGVPFGRTGGTDLMLVQTI